MGDPINIFSGWSGVKHLSQKEIEKMKKNMKKVPEIQLKSDIYHNKEMSEAEYILGKIHTIQSDIPHISTQKTQTYRTTSRIKSLRQRFIWLFSL